MDLPKELTSALLGLILGFKIDKIIPLPNNTIRYEAAISNEKIAAAINIDTLTRLMKEWCLKEYRVIVKATPTIHIEYLNMNEIDSTIVYFSYMISKLKHNSHSIYGESEFEAVLKATHWVAKECKYF